MTATSETLDSEHGGSLLPTAPVDVRHLRVTRSELAKFLGCSKQTTGEWARKGIVTFSPVDDRANLGEAIRQVVERADPKRLRIRAFRDLVRDHDALRKRIAALEARLERADADRAWAIQATRNDCGGREAERLFDLQNELVARFDLLRDAHANGDLYGALDRLIDAIFYPDCSTAGDAADADADEPPNHEECDDAESAEIQPEALCARSSLASVDGSCGEYPDAD